MKRFLACFLLTFGLSQSGFAQTGCGEIQKAFDQITTVYRFGAASASSWATVQQIFGAPTETKEVSGRVSAFIYAFRGCSIEFEICERLLPQRWHHVRGHYRSAPRK